MSEWDCCFCREADWFRYRTGAVLVAEGHALFVYSEQEGHYYSVGGGVRFGETSAEAVVREVREETGETFEIDRPLCLIENFFEGAGTLTGLHCHTLEMYYLMKVPQMHEFHQESYNTGGSREEMRWLPIDRLEEYDIRPKRLKTLLQNQPEQMEIYVNDERMREHEKRV